MIDILKDNDCCNIWSSKIYKKCVLIVKSLLKTMKIKSIINYVTFNNRFVDLLKLQDCCNKNQSIFYFFKSFKYGNWYYTS